MSDEEVKPLSPEQFAVLLKSVRLFDQLAADNMERHNAALLAELDRLCALLDAMRPYVIHADNCGDMDSYNNVPIGMQSCGCGLDSVLEQMP